MGRPPKSPEERAMQLSIRLPADVARDLDALMRTRSEQAGGLPVRKTDFVVHALREWITGEREALLKQGVSLPGTVAGNKVRRRHVKPSK
jgi:hypothetical protein